MLSKLATTSHFFEKGKTPFFISHFKPECGFPPYMGRNEIHWFRSSLKEWGEATEGQAIKGQNQTKTKPVENSLKSNSIHANGETLPMKFSVPSQSCFFNEQVNMKVKL